VRTNSDSEAGKEPAPFNDAAGPVHADQIAHDERRTRWLAEQKIRVIRFSVEEVEARPAAVIAAIVQAVAPSTA
jgi:very-short-patch-repair endonuclease